MKTGNEMWRITVCQYAPFANQWVSSVIPGFATREVAEAWLATTGFACATIEQSPQDDPSDRILSRIFDREIAPDIIAKYGDDDHIAIREAFNDWVDCDNKSYVGTWRNLNEKI